MLCCTYYLLNGTDNESSTLCFDRPANEASWLQVLFRADEEILAGTDHLGSITAKDVEDSVSEACKRYNNSPVVKMYRIEALDMYAAFFIFDTTSDPNFKARRLLPSGFSIHRCPDGICLRDTMDLEVAKQTGDERRREFYNLYSLLRRFVKVKKVHAFPYEHMLCKDEGGLESVSERLRIKLEEKSLKAGSSHLVFVRPTCSRFVSHRGLVDRVIKYCINELLTYRHEVFIVTDVGNMSHIDVSSSVTETSVKISVYSGLKYPYARISVIVIHLSLDPR